MGKYLDLLQNFTIDNYNTTFTPINDTVTDAISVAKQETNGWLGIGFLTFAWLLLFSHISKQENRFNLTIVQSTISVNTIIFCMCLMFLYVEIISSIQIFIWCMLLVFFAQVWGVFRTTA